MTGGGGAIEDSYFVLDPGRFPAKLIRSSSVFDGFAELVGRLSGNSTPVSGPSRPETPHLPETPVASEEQDFSKIGFRVPSVPGILVRPIGGAFAVLRPKDPGYSVCKSLIEGNKSGFSFSDGDPIVVKYNRARQVIGLLQKDQEPLVIVEESMQKEYATLSGYVTDYCKKAPGLGR